LPRAGESKARGLTKARFPNVSDGLDKKAALGLALTLALLLTTGVYWLTEPYRQKGMEDKYKLATAEIFVQNCFYCHGDRGLGGVGLSLRATKLDEEGLKRTISRGVIIMPAWAKEEGGTLTPFQIQGLATFILSWDEKLTEKARDLHPVPPAPPTPPIPPPPYAGMKNPFPWGDEEAVAMGELLYERECVRCHWTSMTKPYSFSLMSSAFSKGLEEHPDFYIWRLSEGWLEGGRTMPPHKLYLPEKQLWQVLNYLWSMGKEWEKVYIY
jgi:mono/diheme cytochrome c family protein